MSYKKKKNKGVPDRWLDYRPVGRRIPGTRIIAFKVPLKPSLNSCVPESDSFSLWELLDSVQSQNQELGLIIDLTFTTRYYRLSDVPQSCCYIKILTEGHRVPPNTAILSFKRAVTHFLNENRDNDKLIGVHCTHGLNRTGYLVCRYLIDVDGLEPAAAVELFNACRGHRIERQNYLLDLQRGAKRSNAGIDQPEQEPSRGLAVERVCGSAPAQRPLPGSAPAQRPLPGSAPAQRPPSGSAPAQRPPSGPAPAQRPPSGPAPAPAQRPPSGPAPAPAQRPPSGPAPAPAQRPPSGPAPAPAQRPPSGPAPAQRPPSRPGPAETPTDPTKETQTPGEKRPPGNRRRRGARHRRGNKPPQSGLLPTPPLPTYQWSPDPS